MLTKSAGLQTQEQMRQEPKITTATTALKKNKAKTLQSWGLMREHAAGFADAEVTLVRHWLTLVLSGICKATLRILGHGIIGNLSRNDVTEGDKEGGLAKPT